MEKFTCRTYVSRTARLNHSPFLHSNPLHEKYSTPRWLVLKFNSHSALARCTLDWKRERKYWSFPSFQFTR